MELYANILFVFALVKILEVGVDILILKQIEEDEQAKLNEGKENNIEDKENNIEDKENINDWMNLKLITIEKVIVGSVSYIFTGIFIATLFTALLRYDVMEVLKYNAIMVIAIILFRQLLKNKNLINYNSYLVSFVNKFSINALMIIQLIIMIKFLFFQ